MPSEAAVRDQLAKMLASGVFARAPRLKAFLQFTVNETLAGRGDSLKELVLASELYGKGFDFDPETNAMVRVDARRLRDKLREYYAEHPADAVVISLPKGSYAPSFHFAPTTAVPKPASGRFGRFILGLAVVCAATIAILGLRPESPPPFGSVSMRKLSRSGTVITATFSPDGRKIAFATGESGTFAGGPIGPESLRIRSVDSAADTVLIPSGNHHFAGITFSPDGSAIDFPLQRSGGAPNSLFRVNVLGGTPRKIVDHVDSPVTYSSDGSRFAFIRETGGESVLLQANRDGSGERRIASIKLPEYLDYPAWSKDGSVFACTLVHRARNETAVVLVDAKTGAIRTLGPQRWRFIRGLSWIRDGRFLILAGRPHDAVNYRVWALEKATGKVFPVSSETDDIVRVSMPASGKRLVGIQRSKTSRLVLTRTEPTGDPVKGARWTTAMTGSVAGGGSRAVAWTKDGRIVYEIEHQLFVSHPNGSDRIQLTFGGENKNPSVCDDGKHLLYYSGSSATGEIWRVPLRGGTPLRLAVGGAFGGPVCGPDVRWFVLASATGAGRPTMYRHSTAGGEPEPLSLGLAEMPAMLSDGSRIAYFTGPGAARRSGRDAIEVVGPQGGVPLHRFPLPNNVDVLARLKWTPDRAGIAYSMHREGSANLWVQPVKGGPPRQLTHLQTSRIFAFDWSWDGRQIGIVMGVEPNDMILIEESSLQR